MKFFWLSKIWSNDSFSRIGENILPILKNKYNYEIYGALPEKIETIAKTSPTNLFDGYLIIGKPNDNNLLKSLEINSLESMVKFTLMQSLIYCNDNKIDILMITMGVYEANLLMKMYNELKNQLNYDIYPKMIIYTPFDYVPSLESIEYYKNADIVITTNNLIDLNVFGIKSYILPHANDSIFRKYPNKNRQVIINILNSLYDLKIEYDDIIVLNANVNDSRKRIEATVKIMSDLMKMYPNKSIKLWINNGEESNLPKNIDILPTNRLIKTSNLPIKDLNLVYNVCQIGIQTSWGEGWSFTNCEHAVCGGIQIVPNWLATGLHFGENRGILVPVKIIKSYNQGRKSIIIGVPKDDLYIESLKQAIDEVEKEQENGQENGQEKETINNDRHAKCVEYFSQFKWSKIVDELDEIIKHNEIIKNNEIIKHNEIIQVDNKSALNC